MLLWGLTLAAPFLMTGQTNLPSTPSTPSWISAYSSGGTNVSVSWQSVTGSVTYGVYRSVNSSSNGSYVGSFSSSSFTDSVPYTPGTFYYRVYACNAGGCSGYSSYASVYVSSSGGGGGGGGGSSSPSLATAVDLTSANFTTGGHSNWWRAVTSNSRQAGDAASSGYIYDYQESWMETTVSGPAEVSFYWRVESELNYDYLRFQVDGSTVRQISGNSYWSEVTYSLPSGQHILRWKYDKDGSVSHYGDRGWVDWLRVEAADSSGEEVVIDLTDFHSGWNAWQNGGTYNWYRDSYGTPSYYTGPYYDHTTGTYGGFYAYMESSYLPSGGTATLVSKELDASLGPIRFSFWYHMYGYGMGSLYVDVWQNGQWIKYWERHGQQHSYVTNPWSKGELDLSSLEGPTKIRIRGVTSRQSWDYLHHRSDMAVDDLTIEQTLLPPDDSEIPWDSGQPFDFSLKVAQPDRNRLTP